MVTKLSAAYFFVLAAVLVGCGGDSGNSEERPNTQVHDDKDWTSIGFDNDVKVIEVENVRCIVVDSDRGGLAIACPEALQQPR